mmetsp:Transcript_13553/g.42662  ORF Transcript_13553/g.42662 Transcript_13553/m.42662 type:complete len:311 (+) Transcript_13553:335-1267(+)
MRRLGTGRLLLRALQRVLRTLEGVGKFAQARPLRSHGRRVPLNLAGEPVGPSRLGHNRLGDLDTSVHLLLDGREVVQSLLQAEARFLAGANGRAFRRHLVLKLRDHGPHLVRRRDDLRLHARELVASAGKALLELGRSLGHLGVSSLDAANVRLQGSLRLVRRDQAFLQRLHRLLLLGDTLAITRRVGLGSGQLLSERPHFCLQRDLCLAKFVGLFHLALVVVETLLAELGKVNDGTEVASRPLGIGRRQIRHGKVGDANGEHQGASVGKEEDGGNRLVVHRPILQLLHRGKRCMLGKLFLCNSHEKIDK